MNFNPMDLIKVKEHFEVCYTKSQVEGISVFISTLIDLQKEGIVDEDLYENLGSYFFKKQELIEVACKLTKRESKPHLNYKNTELP